MEHMHLEQGNVNGGLHWKKLNKQWEDILAMIQITITTTRKQEASTPNNLT